MGFVWSRLGDLGGGYGIVYGYRYSVFTRMIQAVLSPQAQKDDPTAVGEVPEIDRSQPAMDIYTRQTDIWSGLVVETRYSTFSFLETRPDYNGQTERGIRIGHDLQQMQAAYGRPAYLVAGRQGMYRVYEHSRIVFQTDAHGSVQGWMLYAY
jgi:hypothetical protein